MPAEFKLAVQPVEIDCEVTPTTLFHELITQHSRVTPRTPGSGHPTEPPFELCPSVSEYRQRARVIATFFGVLPDGFQEVMTGAIDNPAAHAFAKANYSTVMRDVITERFGPRSYIQKYIRGTLATENCYFLLRTWAIEARRADFPWGEDEPEEFSAIQATWKAHFEEAIQELEQRWTDTYEEKIKNGVSELSTARGLDKTRLQRNIDHWRTIRNQPPRPVLNTDLLQSEEDCQAAKTLPLLLRSKAERLDFWDMQFDKDKLASHLQASRGIIDIRRLAVTENPTSSPRLGQETIPPFPKMISNHWIQSCDILSNLVIGPQQAHRTERLLVDANLAAVAHGWKDYKDVAYKQIRALHDNLGFNAPAYGDWVDAPILS